MLSAPGFFGFLHQNSCIYKNVYLLIQQTGSATVRYQKVNAVTEAIGPTERTEVSIGRGIGTGFKASLGPFDVVHQFDLLSAETYKIKIPDYGHVNLGQGYTTTDMYATTWYPIEAVLTKDYPPTAKDERGQFGRYFHMGRVSLGCVSTKPTARWDEIVQYVSKSRLDNQNVGYLEVFSV